MHTNANRADPVVVLVGNATLLGIGYLVDRRWRAAVIAVLGAAVLVLVLAAEPGMRVWPFALGAWWIGILLHSVWICRDRLGDAIGPDRSDNVWTARIAITGLAAAMAGALFMVRADAGGILDEASQAHHGGDCAEATDVLGRINTAHRIAANADAGDAIDQLDACALLLSAEQYDDPEAAIDALTEYVDHPGAMWDGAGLRLAEQQMAAAVTGAHFESDAEAAIIQLERTLEAHPSLSDEADQVVEGFIAAFGELEPCKGLAVFDWIAARESDDDVVVALSGAAAAQVPAQLVECARADAEAARYASAIALFQRFTQDYPDHELSRAVATELAAAQNALALENERAAMEELLTTGGYCEDPVPYSQAAPRSGDRSVSVWPLGDPEIVSVFPPGLAASALEQTAEVACITGPERGRLLETCEYLGVFAGDVRFYAVEVRVRIYELRTAEVVEDYTVEFDDGTCPEEIEYEYVIGGYNTFPSSLEVEYGHDDLAGVFDRLL